MSNHSWQSLSVQKFFRVSNWEGQLLESSNWQHQNQLKAPWQWLSVQKFFSVSNWEGQIEAKEQGRGEARGKSLFSVPELLSQTSWPCSSVKEFFNLCNWEGQLLDRNWQDQDQSLYLKQVREFFQFIPWEGEPEIGFLLNSSPIPTLTLSDHVGLTFTDLSDLF
jgi:hypothetical protein